MWARRSLKLWQAPVKCERCSLEWRPLSLQVCVGHRVVQLLQRSTDRMLGVAGKALECEIPCDGDLFSQDFLLSLAQPFPARRALELPQTVGYERLNTSEGLLPSQILQDLKFLCERQVQTGATGLFGRQSRTLVGVWTANICGAIITAALLSLVENSGAEPKQGLLYLKSEILHCL